jgi:hypothetical protein
METKCNYMLILFIWLRAKLFNFHFCHYSTFYGNMFNVNLYFDYIETILYIVQTIQDIVETIQTTYNQNNSSEFTDIFKQF